MLKQRIGKKTRSLNGLLRLIVLAALLTSIAVCNVGCNLGEKIGTKITEEMVEESLGEDVEVEIDGDKVNYSTEEGELSIDGDAVTFEGEDGTVISSGTENEWPEGDAANYLPKLTSGVITYVMNGPEACMLMVEEITEEDYSQYLQEVKEAGYTENQTKSVAEGLKIYSGSNKENAVATLSYVPVENSIQITLDTSMLQE
jgi:hypothetical protein